jgi:uncharacterized membrane protein YoaK (UPF0700 family)
VSAIDEHEVDITRRALGGLPSLRRLSPSSVRDLLLVGLTVSSGAVDAISFLALGKVFTAFMTGNVVFLGLGLADAGGPDVLRVSISLAAFAAGVGLAMRILRPADRRATWPPRVSVVLAIALLAEVGFLAGWVASSGRPGTSAGDFLVSLYALAMGLQSGAILLLGLRGIFTTAATGTVIALAGNVAGSPESAPDKRRLAGVLLGLVAGAAAGGLLLVHARELAPLLPPVATALVIAVGRRVFRR